MKDNVDDNIVKLIIDNREREIKDHFKDFNNVSIQNLDIGDICFKKGDETILVIERKTITDLSASICDGRSREQRLRLLGSGISKERIMYLIEGDIIKTKTTVKGGTSTLVGSLINMCFRDGINVYKTISLNETINFIKKLFEKLEKEKDTFWNYENNSEISMVEYSSSLKTKKKENVTPNLWFHKQLTLIPQISSKIAEVITKYYTSVERLVSAYLALEDEKDCIKMLECLTYTTSTGKSRKIGPVISQRVYEFFCPK
jgi:crossover junction endonuclease MUS81